MTFRNKHVVVTGGAGFLGSHLCERLVSLGASVTCVDNLVTGSLSNVTHIKKRFRYLHHDVTRPLYFRHPVYAVLHFASPASPKDYLDYPIQTLKVGSLGTHNMLGLAKEKKARFLLASTSEVYGDPLVHPQREDYWGNVNPVGLRGVYDEAKRFSEAMAMAYHRVHGVKVRIARIFNTYGPRMRPDDGRAIPAFITQALKGQKMPIFGSGCQTRSFTYVDDTVEGLLRLLASDYVGPVNIGNPKEMTVHACAMLVRKLCGSKSEIAWKALPEDDPRVRQPDISIAKKYLKWTPKVSIEEGLLKTIEWFLERKYLETRKAN